MNTKSYEIEYAASKASDLINALIFLQEGTNDFDRKSLELTTVGLLHAVSDELKNISEEAG